MLVRGGCQKIDKSGVLKQLIDKYSYTPLTFKFTGDTQILYKRFVDREKTVERGGVNKIGEDVPYDSFNQWCHNLDDFNVGGEIVPIDTTDFAKVDFNTYVESVKKFLNWQDY